MVENGYKYTFMEKVAVAVAGWQGDSGRVAVAAGDGRGHAARCHTATLEPHTLATATVKLPLSNCHCQTATATVKLSLPPSHCNLATLPPQPLQFSPSHCNSATATHPLSTCHCQTATQPQPLSNLHCHSHCQIATATAQTATATHGMPATP
jgi:hypothetical protein